MNEMERTLFHLRQHRHEIRGCFKGFHGVVEVCRRGSKGLVATLTGLSLFIDWNPVFAMGACKVHENIRLRLGGLFTSWKSTGIRNTDIGIRLFTYSSRRIFRVRLRHMLEIGGFLDKLLIRAMGALIFIVLNVFGLNVIIHSILLLCPLFAILTLEFTGFELGIIGFGGGSGHLD